MGDANITDWIAAIGSIATPLAAGAIAIYYARRHSRSEALTAARLDAYRGLAPTLNLIVCYFTFIGRWKEISPPAAIELKRVADESFHVAAPMFSEDTNRRYRAFINACYDTRNAWGEDALLRTSAFQRRARYDGWQPTWDACFAMKDGEEVSIEARRATRRTYDDLLAAMMRDIELSKARPAYTTTNASAIAHSSDQSSATRADPA